MGVTVVSQLAFVPLYLSYWSPAEYGVWLAVQALQVMTTLVDIAHLNYINFEFLRIGSRNRPALEQLFWTTIPVALAIGLLQLLGVGIFVALGWDRPIYGISSSPNGEQIASQAGIVLLLLVGAWALHGSLGGITTRAISAFGYYSRVGWWNVLLALVTSALPAVAVTMGANLLEAGIVLASSTLLCSLAIQIDTARLLRSVGFGKAAISWPLAVRTLGRSLVLLVRITLDNFRNQGIRIVLAPLAGAAEMATFSTMRTAANVAMQGLNTIANPMLPELMRFLGNREGDKAVLSLSTVWIVVLALLTPAILIFQVVAPWAFEAWTHGKMEFDPLLFAMLSVSVLFYALAQPAAAIAQGNNLLGVQVFMSILSAAVLGIGIIGLYPLLGMRAAALVLALSEFSNLVGYTWVSQRWLKQNSMIWPSRLSGIATGSAITASIGLALISTWKEHTVIACATAVIVQLMMTAWFIAELPPLGRQKLKQILRKLTSRSLAT